MPHAALQGFSTTVFVGDDGLACNAATHTQAHPPPKALVLALGCEGKGSIQSLRLGTVRCTRTPGVYLQQPGTAKGMYHTVEQGPTGYLR